MFALGNDSCSRTAIINGQEVLVDGSSTQKGEGLRFYLQKDPIARSYLQKYQNGTDINILNATLGSLGSALIITRVVGNASPTNSRKLLISGLSLLAINFLVARTLQANNESNLLRAVEEYNQRNSPVIHYPRDKNFNPNKSDASTPIYIEKNWRF